MSQRAGRCVGRLGPPGRRGARCAAPSGRPGRPCLARAHAPPIPRRAGRPCATRPERKDRPRARRIALCQSSRGSGHTARFQVLKERSRCRSSTRWTSLAPPRLVANPAVGVPPGRPRAQATRQTSRSIQARRGIAAAALLIVVDPDRPRRAQLPGELAQQRPEGLHQQRLLADPALGEHRHQPVPHPLAAAPAQRTRPSLNNQINQARADAAGELATAQGLSVPDEVRGAQTNLVTAMRMRVDGITTIAGTIQPALGTSTRTGRGQAIAVAMARFYASDVLYKLYAAPAIAGALHNAGIAVGAPNGQAISGKQFVPDVHWLDPTYVATILHAEPRTTARSRRVCTGTRSTRSPSPVRRCRPARRTRCRPTRPSRSTTPTGAPTTRPTSSAR